MKTSIYRIDLTVRCHRNEQDAYIRERKKIWSSKSNLFNLSLSFSIESIPNLIKLYI